MHPLVPATLCMRSEGRLVVLGLAARQSRRDPYPRHPRRSGTGGKPAALNRHIRLRIGAVSGVWGSAAVGCASVLVENVAVGRFVMEKGVKG